MSLPLVSIVVTTYNHEDYIKKCLDSILEQQTNFPIEIILGEDESSDGTRKICQDYANRFPDIIKLFLRSRKDVIYINGRPTGRYNFIESLKSAKGKYIALCEGDDYWIDPNKLQKQVDFLEANPNLSACHHWQKIAIFEDGNYIEVNAPKDGHGYLNKKTSTVKELFLNNVRLKSRTLMYRNVVDTSLFNNYFKNAAFGDVPLSFILGKHGDFGFIDEEMAVYRLTGKGSSNAGLKELGFKKFRIQHFKNWIEIWDRADVFYGFKYHNESARTVNFFYKKIITQFNFNFRTLLKLLKYNRNRALPYIKLFKHDLWLIWIFFKLKGYKDLKRFKNFIK